MSTTQPTTTPTASDLLRLAIDEAPAGLRVDRDAYDELALFDEDDTDVLAFHLDQDIARLLGLLLAAAPALPALLDAITSNADPTAPARALRQAITQAGEVL